MAIYKYKAIDFNGNIIKGNKIATNDIELIEEIHNENLYLLDYKITKYKDLFYNFNFVNYKDIAMLSKQLGELLKCGINIEKAIEILSNEKIKISIRKSLFSIKIDIEKGRTLSDAINKFPEIYPKFMRQIVAVGEKSGKLDEVLLKLSSYYLKKYKINKKVKMAFMYPLIILIMTITITLFVTLNIVPKFAENFIKLNKPIPNGIEKILQFNTFLKSYKLYFLVFLVFFIIHRLYKRGSIEVLLYKCCNIGDMGRLYKEIYEISILESLSILLNSGIPLISSLDIILRSIHNKSIKNKIIKVILNIKEGMSFSSSLRCEKMFNEFFLCMISVGEKVGNIEEFIDNGIEIKEQEIYTLINKLIKSIQPISILILGIIITLIMGNILFPMIDTMDFII